MSLTSDLKRIAEKQKLSLTQVYRLTMNDLSNQMITSSPVDTGTFKANWLSAINIGDFSYDKGKTNISESQGRLTAITNQLEHGETFYFTNSMPYAQKLEDGHSKFAAQGIVKVAINDFPQIVDQRVRELGS